VLLYLQKPGFRCGVNDLCALGGCYAAVIRS